MSKTVSILFVVAVILLAGVTWYVLTQGPGTGDTDPQISQCEADVRAAQESAQGTFCTQQIQNLRCPDDESFTYEAPNGCEISYLKGEGWSEVSETGSAAQ